MQIMMITTSELTKADPDRRRCCRFDRCLLIASLSSSRESARVGNVFLTYLLPHRGHSRRLRLIQSVVVLLLVLLVLLRARILIAIGIVCAVAFGWHDTQPCESLTTHIIG